MTAGVSFVNVQRVSTTYVRFMTPLWTWRKGGRNTHCSILYWYQTRSSPLHIHISDHHHQENGRQLASTNSGLARSNERYRVLASASENKLVKFSKV